MMKDSSIGPNDISKNPEVARLVLGPHRGIKPISSQSQLSCLPNYPPTALKSLLKPGLALELIRRPREFPTI